MQLWKEDLAYTAVLLWHFGTMCCKVVHTNIIIASWISVHLSECNQEERKQYVEKHLSITLLNILLLIFSVYGEPIPVKELAQRVASYVHLCTLYWWLRFDIVISWHFVNNFSPCLIIATLWIPIGAARPFGCGVILGGYDRDGPQLYMVEPSGVSYVS